MGRTSRRAILATLIFGGIVSLPLRMRSALAGDAASQGEAVQFRWRVPTVYFETVKSELHFEGEITQEKDTKGLPLLYVFVGTVLLPYLAKAVLALRREIIQGGVVIDTRSQKIDIYTDKSLPGGVIIVLTKDGTQLYERDEIGNPSELVSTLLKGR